MPTMLQRILDRRKPKTPAKVASKQPSPLPVPKTVSKRELPANPKKNREKLSQLHEGLVKISKMYRQPLDRQIELLDISKLSDQKVDAMLNHFRALLAAYKKSKS